MINKCHLLVLYASPSHRLELVGESKMVGQVAIQRKLLLLTYTLWKNDTTFVEHYKKSSSEKTSEATQDNLKIEASL